MSVSRSYLDHNAGSPLRPEVAEAVVSALGLGGNPSSIHAEGRRARAMIERARAQVAALVGASPDRVVFTSGGTEANNLALAAAARSRILVSPTEHVAILEGHGVAAETVEHLTLDDQGLLDFADLEDRLTDGTSGPVLVAVQIANNETGIVQPVRDIAALAGRHGARVHSDAVQAAGRIAIGMAELGVDSLALSAHKLGGPSGAGALVLGTDRDLTGRLIAGGSQEGGRRGGTENLAGIVGFGVAAEIAFREREQEAARLSELRSRLELDIRRIAPGSVIFGADVERLPNTTCFAIPGLTSTTALIALDLAGLAVSSGAACSSGRVRRSHVLDAMRIDPALAEGAVRVSLGWTTHEKDLCRFAGALETLVGRLYQRRIERAA